MQSHSFQVSSVETLHEKLRETLSDNFQATLAIAFVATNYDLTELSKLFDQYAIDIIGCTSAGSFKDDEINDGVITILLLDMPKTCYHIYNKEKTDKTSYQIAHEVGAYSTSIFDNPAIIVFSGGMGTDGEKIVAGIKDGVGRELPLYGGLAGDDLKMISTHIFSNNWVCADGLTALIINTDRIQVGGMAIAGWKSIGVVNTITKAKDNILYEINNQPALDVFTKYFGFHTPSIEEDGAALETISGQYPLQVFRKAGYKVMRSPLSVNKKEKALILAGGVKTGEQFKFSVAAGFQVVEETVSEFSVFKKEYPDVDALLLISCKARHTAFGPLLEDELKGLTDYWPNQALTGFFSYGEIGKVKNGSCDFHNVTATLVTLKEISDD